jgi:hypothetical protein
MSFANPQWILQVHTEVAHETTEKARKERMLNLQMLNLKSKRSLVITF